MPTASFHPVYDAVVRNSGATFSTVRDAATGTAVVGASATFISTQCDNKSDATSVYIDRPGYTFNTSALGAVTVTGATLTIICTGVTNTEGGSVTTHVVGFTPATPTAFVTGDFGQFGSVSFASSTSALAYTSAFVLSAAGYGSINTGGYTSFGLREASEFSNSPPAVGKYHTSDWRTVDYTGTDFDPILDVTYTLAAGTSARRRRPSGLYTR